MTIPSGIWTACYKIMTMVDRKMISYNQSINSVQEMKQSGELPGMSLRYFPGKITVPKYGKLFCTSELVADLHPVTPIQIWEGLGLNVINEPEEMPYLMWAPWGSPEEVLKKFWLDYAGGYIDRYCREGNPIPHTILADAFIPLGKVA